MRFLVAFRVGDELQNFKISCGGNGVPAKSPTILGVASYGGIMGISQSHRHQKVTFFQGIFRCQQDSGTIP